MPDLPKIFKIHHTHFNILGNANNCKRVQTSILNLTEFTDAEIKALKDNMDIKRDKMEMGFNNITKEQEALATNIGRLASQIDKMGHRIDHTDKNISRELSTGSKTTFPDGQVNFANGKKLQLSVTHKYVYMKSDACIISDKDARGNVECPLAQVFVLKPMRSISIRK